MVYEDCVNNKKAKQHKIKFPISILFYQDLCQSCASNALSFDYQAYCYSAPLSVGDSIREVYPNESKPNESKPERLFNVINVCDNFEFFG